MATYPDSSPHSDLERFRRLVSQLRALEAEEFEVLCTDDLERLEVPVPIAEASSPTSRA